MFELLRYTNYRISKEKAITEILNGIISYMEKENFIFENPSLTRQDLKNFIDDARIKAEYWLLK